MAINYHDGGGNPYAPEFTNITVAPADLAEFADLLDSDLKAINDAWERWLGEIESQPAPNFHGAHPAGIGYGRGHPEVIYSGSDGIREGAGFYRAYDRTLQAERMLMSDLIRGLEILRDAARMIHDGYLASDTANADDVEAAFAAYERPAVVEAFDQLTHPAGGEDPERPG